MRTLSIILVSPAFLAGVVQAHTYVWSVWVNGVDQGTGVGIRNPPYNGPPLYSPGNPPFGQGSGFRSWPMRDLDSIDMRCHALGEQQNPYTIKVKPNDIVTFEWHHNHRAPTDDIIDSSHKGAGVVYISPDPPGTDSWVKIQQEGENPKGTFYVGGGGKLAQRRGKQDVRIPPNLAAGYYLLRPELITLHEAEVTWVNNTNRGVQLYMNCIQVEVTGSGAVRLPTGVSFPGVYKYDDPGINYNVYYQPVGAPLYQIPGPPVWSGAAASPNPPAYGATIGVTTQTTWSSWINSFAPTTARTMITYDLGNSQRSTRAYTASWSTVYRTPAATTAAPALTSRSSAVVAPSTRTSLAQPAPTGTVPRWGQCGGTDWSGPTVCAPGTTCVRVNEFYFQCQ